MKVDVFTKKSSWLIVTLVPILLIVIGQSQQRASQTATITQEQWQTVPNLMVWHDRASQLRQLTIKIKPMTLSAHLHHPGLSQEGTTKIPQDGWLIGFLPELVGAPAYTLHHADYVNLSTPSEACPSLPNMFYSFGVERREGSALPSGYGYPVKAGDQIGYSVMFHNPDSQTYDQVSANLKLLYLPAGAGPLTSVYPMYLDVTGPCQRGDFRVPAHQSFTKTMPSSYQFTRKSQIIAYGGHLHQFGQKLTVSLNDQELTAFTPIFDIDRRVFRIPVQFPESLHIRSGDTMRLEVSYANPTDNDADGMGKLLIYYTHE